MLSTMATPLERRFEDLALRMAAAPGGVPGLGIAARVPLPPLRTLELLGELARRGPLTVEERDGIRHYRAEGTPPRADACPGCARPLPPAAPICPECRAGFGRCAEAEHAVLAALAAANGEEVTLATLAAASALTARETEDLMTALAGRGAVAVSADPGRVAWRPPVFEAPAAFVQAFRAQPGRRRPHLGRALLRHHRRIVLTLAITWAAVTAVGYLHYSSTRKSAANAYWRAFFTVKNHEELLARYVDRIPGLDAARARADLASMAELDVKPRLRRDYLLHRMVYLVHKDGGHEDAAEVLQSLADFEQKWAEESARYDERARAHRAAVRSPWGRVAGWLFRVETLYDPLPPDLFGPGADNTK